MCVHGIGCWDEDVTTLKQKFYHYEYQYFVDLWDETIILTVWQK